MHQKRHASCTGNSRAADRTNIYSNPLLLSEVYAIEHEATKNDWLSYGSFLPKLKFRRLVLKECHIGGGDNKEQFEGDNFF